MPKKPAPKPRANPLGILEQDHRSVATLFKRLKGSKSGEARVGLLLEVKAALGLHAVLEEQILYPAVRSCPSSGAQTAATLAYDQHEDIQGTLADIETTAPEDPRFLAKCLDLEALVARHVEAEEQELFPLARKLLPAERLEALGRRLAATRAEQERAVRDAREAAPHQGSPTYS